MIRISTQLNEMTDLQNMVCSAIKSAKTDEERSNAAISAVRVWYMQQGYFGRAYQLDEHVGISPERPDLVEEESQRVEYVKWAKKTFPDLDFSDDAKVEITDEGVFVEGRVFMYHFHMHDRD